MRTARDLFGDFFMRELGAIDNITYRQLNSDITTRKASLDLHRMCEMGLFELKGQGRNAYYIAGQKFISLNGREMCRADEEMCRADGEMCRADGENSNAIGENSNAIGENSRANGEISNAIGENGRADGEMCRAEDLPNELKERIDKTGKRIVAKDMENLIVDLCAFQPLSLADIASLLHREKVSLRNHYLNPLMEQGKLFYTIPEMLNHPKQKYTTKKKK